MGISQLSKVLKIQAKSAIFERPLAYYSGKVIAMDASMSIYQFLIAIRNDEGNFGGDEGTSHLIGLFYRTVRLVEMGIKIIYVFDGEAPEHKIEELKKRAGKREKADEKYKQAALEGDKAEMMKQEKRKVKVTREHVEDCKKLLDVMKVPYITAPSEAEAYCAHLAQKGIVYAVGTEDMDALTFGAPVLLRNLNASESKKLPIMEYNLKKILSAMELTMNQFIDMCIILGCDYTKSMKGVGPQRAYSFIKKYKSIENILENEKIKDAEDFNYKLSREIFMKLPSLDKNTGLTPESIDQENIQDSENHIAVENRDKISDKVNTEIKWGKINLEEVLDFLVKEKKFSEERVKKGMERFFKGKSKPKQTRMDDFF